MGNYERRMKNAEEYTRSLPHSDFISSSFILPSSF